MPQFALMVLIPRQIRSKSDGEHFLNLLIQHFPECLPQRFGNTEPLSHRFDHDSIGSALELWGTGSFIAERRHPRLHFMVHFWPLVSKDPRHSSITFFTVETDAESVREFLSETCETFGVDYGLAHPLTKAESDERLQQIREQAENGPHFQLQLSHQLKSRLETNGYASMLQDELLANIERVTKIARGRPELANREMERIKPRITREGFATVLSGMITTGNHTVHLRKRLQDLYWMNIFGRPYVELFGRERLLASPVAQVRELSNSIYLKVTERLEDNESSWKDFKIARGRCKTHLDSNAFFDPSERPGHAYQVPTFVFASE